MNTDDRNILDKVEQHFSIKSKPKRFTPNDDDFESEDKNNFWMSMQPDTLTEESICCDLNSPLTELLPGGWIYYMSGIARVILKSKYEESEDWVAGDVVLQMSGSPHIFFMDCNNKQKETILIFLNHILISRKKYLRAGHGGSFGKGWQLKKLAQNIEVLTHV